MSQVLENLHPRATQNGLGASVRQAIRHQRSRRAAVDLKGHLPISRRLNDEGRAERDRYAACELAGKLFPNLPSF